MITIITSTTRKV